MNVHMTVHILRTFITHNSHASEEENRTRNCNFSCDFLLLEDMKEYRLLNDVVMKFHNLEHL